MDRRPRVGGSPCGLVLGGLLLCISACRSNGVADSNSESEPERMDLGGGPDLGLPACSDACTAKPTGIDCGAVGGPCAEGACESGSCEASSCTCVLAEDGMLFVPGGQFWMGCNPEVDLVEGQTCEGEVFSALPYRQVEVSPFWIDRTEVTWADYDACIEAGICPAIESACGPPAPTEPVCTVLWSAARDFCQWKDKRLPTEAEWEKAARGVDGRRYPWGTPELTCEHAEFYLPPDAGGPCNENNGPEPVGSFLAGASPYGALDMAGNIMEWVADGYVEGSGYEGLPDIDPVGPDAEYRVARGSAYDSREISTLGYSLRASQRQAHKPEVGAYFLGFRCARPDG